MHFNYFLFFLLFNKQDRSCRSFLSHHHAFTTNREISESGLKHRTFFAIREDIIHNMAFSILRFLRIVSHLNWLLERKGWLSYNQSLLLYCYSPGSIQKQWKVYNKKSKQRSILVSKYFLNFLCTNSVLLVYQVSCHDFILYIE